MSVRLIGHGMMWRFTGDRSLSKPMMTQFTGKYSPLGRNELTSSFYNRLITFVTEIFVYGMGVG